MADRNPARLAAPLALLAAAVAVVVVVQASRSSSPSVSQSATSPVATQPVRRTRTAASRVYVVKPGDTLSVIADKADVSLEEIQRLNPQIDPNALQTGQRLKLSR
jgi:LysM repeat protein